MRLTIAILSRQRARRSLLRMNGRAGCSRTIGTYCVSRSRRLRSSTRSARSRGRTRFSISGADSAPPSSAFMREPRAAAVSCTRWTTIRNG